VSTAAFRRSGFLLVPLRIPAAAENKVDNKHDVKHEPSSALAQKEKRQESFRIYSESMSGINNVRGTGADAKVQIVSSRQWRYCHISARTNQSRYSL
jgi:hypothetical protein